MIGLLREAESGLPVAELCRRHGFSEASYYRWRKEGAPRRSFQCHGAPQGSSGR